MSDVIYGSVSTKDNRNSKNNNANMNSEAPKKAPKKAPAKKASKKVVAKKEKVVAKKKTSTVTQKDLETMLGKHNIDAVEAIKEVVDIKKKGAEERAKIRTQLVTDVVEDKTVAESSTSGQAIVDSVITEADAEPEPEIELTEEQKKKLDFKLVPKGEKALDNYIDLLKGYLKDLDNYQNKEDNLVADTLTALMSQDEIVA